MTRLVEIQGLHRRFGSVHAVRDLSFGFDRGQIFGFIGPNGAGKSTTMRILATLDLPSAGSCLVDGRSTTDDADRIRNCIGYMPDSYGSYPNMTVAEYLDFFARAHGLRGADRASAVAGVMDFCQLDGLRDKLITTLSKGMKQRLCLGRCLIHDPPLLILDEPSAGLDPRARIEFRELLRILKGRGKGILISSHILAELEEICDAVAIIEQGRLVATGAVSAVKAQVRSAREAQAGSDDAHLVELRLAAPCPRLEALLAEQPEIRRHRLDGDTWLLELGGGAEDRARVLARLVAGGAAVCHFASRDANLEDVFLHLTEGVVQ